MPKISLNREQLENLTLEYSVSKAEPCIINILYINGILSSIFDFGTIKDIAPSSDKTFFGCNKRRFLPYSFIPPAKLEKLQISKEESSLICRFLAKKMNRDKCEFCNKK